MSLLGAILRAVGGVLGLLVLLVAIVWGWHESSALRPGRGLNVPSSLYGTNAIVTGSTAGIGFETALQLFELGAHVIVHSSDQKRADTSAQAVRAFADNWGGKVTPLAANLGKFQEVVDFSKKLPAVMPRVHLLFLNAAMMYGLGAMYKDDSVMKLPASAFQAPSGHDNCMAINHLGHYLLTLLLLPQLAPGATIVVMTSNAAWGTSHRRLMPPWGYLGKHKFNKNTSTPKRIKWESPGLKRHSNVAYQDSKYANVCFGRWLRRKLGSNYTVVLHDPGFVLTSPAMNRSSRQYRERLYRKSRQKKLWKWHAPTVDGGRHLLESAFVSQRPMPDLVVSFFFPRQVVGLLAGYWWEDYRRNAFLAQFSRVQKLTWGLHGSVGPQCDPDLQDRFMAWSADAIGAKRAFPANFR